MTFRKEICDKCTFDPEDKMCILLKDVKCKKNFTELQLTYWQKELRLDLDNILRSNYIDHHVLVEKLEVFIQGEIKKAFDEVEIDCYECGGQASNIDKIKFKRGINNDN